MPELLDQSGKVLNALRHQRNDRVEGNTGISVRFLVLNALRHQRNDRKQQWQRVYPEKNVLNALRHQRNDRSMTASQYQNVFECSTPYGIKGTIAEQ